MTKHLICCAAASASLLLAGCSKSANATAAPDALPAEQMKATLGKAFVHASAETRAAVDKYEAAVQSKNAADAFVALQDLRVRPDLTQDQRMLLGRAMRTTSEALQAAIAAGDERAEQTLHDYQQTR